MSSAWVLTPFADLPIPTCKQHPTDRDFDTQSLGSKPQDTTSVCFSFDVCLSSLFLPFLVARQQQLKAQARPSLPDRRREKDSAGNHQEEYPRQNPWDPVNAPRSRAFSRTWVLTHGADEGGSLRIRASDSADLAKASFLILEFLDGSWKD